MPIPKNNISHDVIQFKTDDARLEHQKMLKEKEIELINATTRRYVVFL
jgi:hypothetical protein